MPSKYSRKQLYPNSYYHIYNRGINKQPIFKNKKDYKTFLSFLKLYLLPPLDPKTTAKDVTFKGQAFKGIPKQPKNYFQDIDLIVYCLMPNHYHFLLKQKSVNSAPQFIQSLVGKYVMYFNKTHQRIGPLFQGRYKAIQIENDEYLLHLSRYIHLNPKSNFPILSKAYSSYAEYIGIRKTSWIKPQPILDFFSSSGKLYPHKPNTYQEFVENYQTNSKEILAELALD